VFSTVDINLCSPASQTGHVGLRIHVITGVCVASASTSERMIFRGKLDTLNTQSPNGINSVKY